ncbi:neutral zinc metallopeptidase [Mesonia sp. HuA40]|uniref:KPN_02809 family neutral zinc metallopeptidase n=1 Tax=Mesonia sp. HuA40 TaxID=2602761 RepID=UPI0011C840D1|nr:neutral zinc metallopeptidase [Mesonia sp. HuA40]TXK73215.1 metalloprotease [Mesonia sp. HuA40]
MKWKGRRKSNNLEDRRGMSGKGKIAAGGGLIAIIVILLQVFGGETGQAVAPVLNQLNTNNASQQVAERELTDQEKELGDFMATILADTEDVWTQIFRQNNIGDYQKPKMILFSDAVQTKCGNATAATGPFYCPADQNVYMDLTFFNELYTRFGAKRGDFAMAYVTAHEIGHHVQTLLGTSQNVRRAQQNMNAVEANKLSVALELQADFYAGLWAHYNQQYLEKGDIEEALSAAQAVGDDAIQKRVRGSVNPDTFTHGTSKQRMYWFLKGFQSGDMKQHNTFKALNALK